MTTGKAIDQAIDVLKMEAEGILKLIEKLDDGFTRMADLICKSRGRVIISGIGKSGIIGRKIVATLNSTGTRAIFLHPVEAMHGDLGIVSGNDIFIAMSNSGETDELNVLLPSIRNAGCPIIAFTGNKQSTLARNSDIVINVGVDVEACPLGLAPTTSTTALLAMGDALAVVLINKKKFTPGDFKKIHPGGNLGHRLSYKVQDMMLTGEAMPEVYEGAGMDAALEIMDKKKLGVVLILKKDNTLAGIITDGDVRRMLVNKISVFEKTADALMVPNPKSILQTTPLYDALNIMETHQITVLPVVDDDGKVSGVLHLHDILGKGAVKFNGI
ncbi:MAG: KpsF/GutQ family sugar-phosphate isomerase [Desulfobacteraceae bacterium]|nr:MAG: KpsF/GutQ family sugar-phosphate isomerase [Desulfobacteraceae bacterium]